MRGNGHWTRFFWLGLSASLILLSGSGQDVGSTTSLYPNDILADENLSLETGPLVPGASALPGEAKVNTVAPIIGPGVDYTSIQDAIDNVDPGDVIYVQSGTYDEVVTVNKPDLYLKGIDTGDGKPVVSGDGVESTVTLSSDGCTLEGFVVMNSGNPHAGITVLSNNNIITNNTAIVNRGYGIHLNRSRNNLLWNNNVSTNGFSGISLQSSAYNNITSNFVRHNNLSGIELLGSAQNTISLNVASDNGEHGIRLLESDENLLAGNIASNNTLGGISIQDSVGTVVDGNVVIEVSKVASTEVGLPSTIVNFTIAVTNAGQVDFDEVTLADQLPAGLDYVSDNRSGDFEDDRIVWTLPGSLAANKSVTLELSAVVSGAVFGNLTNSVRTTGLTSKGVLVSDEASTVVVALLVVDSEDSLSKAIELARPGDVVEVKSGTYHERIVLNKSITLKGVDTGSGPPVLAGDGVGSTITLAADGCAIEGFVVTGSGNPHAGIEIVSNDNSISNNVIKNNKGYGVLITGSKGNAVIANEIRENGFDGVHIEGSEENEVSDNVVSINGRSGIVLDGSSDNAVSSNRIASNKDQGIDLVDASGNALQDNAARGNSGHGVRLIRSEMNSATGNVASNNKKDGIHLDGSNDNDISENTANGNLNGLRLINSVANSLSDNTASGNQEQGIRLRGSRENTLSGNAFRDNLLHGVHLIRSNNNSLVDNDVMKNKKDGIYIEESSGNEISANSAQGNKNGLSLWSSSENKISSNDIKKNDQTGIALTGSGHNNLASNVVAENSANGIGLSGSNDNTISGGTVSANKANGIHLEGSSRNWISANTIEKSVNGLGLVNSFENTLSSNTVQDNSGRGVYLTGSGGNKIYLNTITNLQNALSEGGSNNRWFSPTPMNYVYRGKTFIGYRGNFWSDYAGNDVNGDGIGDSAYKIPGSTAEDSYPLTNRGVRISKTSNISSGCRYAEILFRIEVTNTGEVALNPVRVADVLPSGLEYVSDNRSGNVAGKTIVWSNLGPIAPGAKTSVQLVARIDGTKYGPLVNAVNVTGTSSSGKKVSSKNATNVTVLRSGIKVEKAVSPRGGLPGTNLTFTIKVTNTGEAVLNPVGVVDELPSGLEYVSDNRSGTVAGSSVTWNLGTLPPKGKTFIRLVARIKSGTESGNATNLVNVTGTLLAGDAVTDEASCPVRFGIQAAIDEASPGDEIIVPSGTYRENVVVNKPLTLKKVVDWLPCISPLPSGLDNGSSVVVDAGGVGSAITITADGCTVDGLIARNSSIWPNAGIKVASNNNIVNNNTATNNGQHGLLIYNSNSNTISGNTAIENGGNGIHLESSEGNTISGNTADNNGQNGIKLIRSANNNEISGNNVAHNRQRGILLYSSNDNEISSNIVESNNWTGIYLIINCCRNTISDNIATGNGYAGIYIETSSDNTISGNTAIVNSNSGVELRYSNGNNISRNAAQGNTYFGVYLSESNGNTISDNTVTENGLAGINLVASSTNNTIYSNNATDNNNYGIRLGSSAGNTIYLNTFNNANNAWSDSVNAWHSPNELEYRGNSTYVGNQWSDYTGWDCDGDGIGDVLYEIPGGAEEQDEYPLTDRTGTRTLTVCASGCNYTSIQAAIDAACPGDTIEVQSGTYNENVAVNKTLTLRGLDTGGGMPVVDAGGSGSAITIAVDGCRVEGFRVTNSGEGAYPNLDAGIKVTSDGNTIEGNNASENYNGIYIYFSSCNTISDNTATGNIRHGIYLFSSCNSNTISGNTATGNVCGIIIDYFCSNNTISGNTAAGNSGHGIYLDRSTNNTISDNIVIDTGPGYNGHGIYISYSSSCMISGNTAADNGGSGIYLSRTSSSMLSGNTANSNDFDGILLDSFSDNNTISGNTANGNDFDGICLDSSSGNTLSDNTADDNNDGIYLLSSSGNTLSDNNATDNGWGIWLEQSGDNSISDNVVNDNNRGICLWFSSGNKISDNTASKNSHSGIFLESSSGNTLSDNTASNNDYGILLYDSCDDNIIENNTATGNSEEGISLYSSNNGNLSDNTASDNKHGIYLGCSNSNTISGNTGTGNDYAGISLSSSSNNTLSGNNAADNTRYGILLSFSSNNNRLTNNNANDNAEYGIRLESSNGNTIYQNNFENAENAWSNSANTWSSPTEIEYRGNTTYVGNKWSNYSGRDCDGDGIGEVPYNIPGGSEKDDYPLTDNFGTIITVCASGCNYTSIQAAIDAACPGDTIEVQSGTYNENVVVNKTLTLRGLDTGGGMPVVDAGGSGSVITLSTDRCTLEGFVATNGAEAGIWVTSNDNTISGNTATGNDDGILLFHSSNNNRLTNNTVTDNLYGIYLTDSHGNTISSNDAKENVNEGIYLKDSSDNTLLGNTAIVNRGGIYLDSYSNDNRLTNNNATNNVGCGITLSSSSNNNLLGNTATGNGLHGISLGSSSDSNMLSGNTASDNMNGICLWDSSGNTISGNTASDNMNGIVLNSSSDNTFSGNTANCNEERGIYLGSSNDNTLSDNTATGNGASGISLDSSSDNTISGNTASGNTQVGIHLKSSSGNSIEGNTASSNHHGIDISTGSDNNRISNNIANNNDDVNIYFYDSDYSSVSCNKFSNDSSVSWPSIFLVSSNHNIILENIASGNTQGIRLQSSSDNTIYLNSFINNVQNANSNSAGNRWNSTEPLEPYNNYTGNRWSDYSGSDANGDGIGDLPYSIPGGSEKDYYPIMTTVVGPGGNIQAAINAASANSTILVLSGTYYENVALNKPLKLIGIDTGGGKPVVDAGGSGSAITIAADGCTVEGFVVTNGDAGVEVASNFNTIECNTATNNRQSGIYLQSSSGNTISSNTAANNTRRGIFLYLSSGNAISSNTANANGYYGICLDSSSGNTIFQNTFNNTNNAFSNSANSWNSTVPLNYTYNSGSYTNYTGNYWSDYAGSDPDGDGIGNSPYSISGGSEKDYYPMISGVAPSMDAAAFAPAILMDLSGDLRAGSASDAVNLTLNATNPGPENLTSVKIVALIPAGMSYLPGRASVEPDSVEKSPNGTWTAAWENLTDLGAGESARIDFAAKIDGDLLADLTTFATASASVDDTGGRVDETGSVRDGEVGSGDGGEIVSGMDAWTISVKGSVDAKIKVDKTADPLVAEPGDLVAFSINVTNSGAVDLSNLTVADLLPAGMSYVSASRPPSFGPVEHPNGTVFISWTGLKGLAPNESVGLELVARVDADAAGSLTNSVSVAATYWEGGAMGIVDASDDATVQLLALKVTKVANKEEVKRGEKIAYNITVCNVGSLPIMDLVLEDVFDHRVDVVSESISRGPDGRWQIDHLENGSCISIILIVKVPRQEFEFEMASRAAGEGFVNVADDYSTTLDLFVIRNLVRAISKNLRQEYSDSASVAVLGEPGTELETREHGSGSYEGDEQVRVRTENKSISMEKDVTAAYAPTTLGLYRNRTVNYSSRWTEEARAKNRITGTSMSESYRHATSIDRESRIFLDKNESAMEIDSEFDGMGHIGFLKRDLGSSPGSTPLFESREDYVGSFRVLEKADEYGSGIGYERSASGRGLVSVDKRVGSSQRSYESGAGSYDSEELIRTETNYIAKYLSVESGDVDAGLSSSFSANSSMKWKEGIWSSSAGSSFIGEEYAGASQLEMETIAMGLSEMDSQANFTGRARYRAIHEDEVDFDEGYEGTYSVQRRVLLEGVPRYDRPHLSLRKEGEIVYPASDASPLASYAIILENDGDQSLGPVIVRDLFPPGAVYVNSSLRPSELAEGRAAWTLTHLAIGDRFKIELRLNLTGYRGDEIVNQVEAEGGYNGNWVRADNFSAVEIDWLRCCPSGDAVTVTKSGRIDQNEPNQVLYTITVENVGEGATAAAVADYLPDGMVVAEASPEVASLDDGVATWNLVEMMPGETRTINYRAEARWSGKFVNRVRVDASPVDGSGMSTAYASSIVDVGEFEREIQPPGWQPPDWGLNYTAYQPEITADGVCNIF